MMTKSSFRHLSLLTVTAAVMLAACQAPAATQPPPTPTEATPAGAPTEAPAKAPTPTSEALAPGGIDACALLTATNAEATLGKPVRKAETLINGEGNGVVTSCKYRATDDVTLSTGIIVRKLDSAEWAKQFYAQTEKDMATTLSVTPEDVTGVGEAAFWVGDMYNQLYALKGSVHVLLDVSNQTSPNDTVKGLMTKILDRLP